MKIENIKGDNKPPIILVGNKSDLENKRYLNFKLNSKRNLNS